MHRKPSAGRKSRRFLPKAADDRKGRSGSWNGSDHVAALLDDCEVVPANLEECLGRLKRFTVPYVATLPRSELRRHGEDFIRGLLSDIERKSTEPIAERAGKHRRGLQRFIGESAWDHKAMLDELNRQVASEIGSPDGILILDPSSFPKKGRESVAVARQWSGRLGKVDNCQVGVFLGYASGLGHTLVDERLYIPKEWAKDKARREKCHVPKRVSFKTSHELGLEMLEERRGRLPHGWVIGDDEFGQPAWFRARLRQMRERYILEIPSNISIATAENLRLAEEEGRPWRSCFMTATRWKNRVPKGAWIRVPIREGIKGPLVVWAARVRVRTKRGRTDRRLSDAEEWLLVTRTEGKIPEYRYYLSDADVDIPIERMVRVANARFWIEDCFERAKGRLGMDHYEVRSWQGWHHHMALSMLGLWFLVLEQRRLDVQTPAMTVQQTAEAIGELLREPDIDPRRLALKITRRLKRTELARIAHWRRFERLPARWADVRGAYAAQ